MTRDLPRGTSPSAGRAEGIGDAPQFSLRGVSFRYADDLPPVLSDVDLDIRAGERVCLLGANGSGKSTLLQLLNALLLPIGGTVTSFGRRTDAPGAALEARRRAAMVFQNPDDQMVAPVVADDVAFGPENLGVPHEQIAERVDESLATVAMGDCAQADPAELSGGQKQRVAIASALAMRPRALLLDEPGAMLDVRGRRGILRVLARLQARGITVVHVTHFMEDALAAQRVVVLDRGQVALDGTPHEVFSHAEKIRALGLEPPLARRLSERLRADGLDVPATDDVDSLVDGLAVALCR